MCWSDILDDFPQRMRKSIYCQKNKVQSAWRKKAQIIHLLKDGQGKSLRPMGQGETNRHFFLNAFISFIINHC